MLDLVTYQFCGSREQTAAAGSVRSDVGETAAVCAGNASAASVVKTLTVMADDRMPDTALTDCHRALRESHPDSEGGSAGLFQIRGGLLCGAVSGSCRIQIFRDGQLLAFTGDRTEAWQRFRNGEFSYEELRMQPGACEPLAVFGGDAEPQPSRIRCELQAGDGVLLCTDGLWQFLFETEACIDLLKAEDAAAWRDYLLVRLTDKTHLAGEAFAMACGIWTEE